MLQQPKCTSHPSQTLDFYCEECYTLACTSCVLSSAHRAHSHNVTDISIALPIHRERLHDYITEANGCLQGAENMMDNSASSVHMLQENCKRAESKIQKYFYRMRTILTDRERHFSSLLKRSVSEKKKTMTEERKSIKVSLANIIDGLKSLDELSKRREEDISVLQDDFPVISKLKGHMQLVHQQVDSDISNFDTTVTMPCFEDQNFEKICRRVGDPGYRVCPHNCARLSGFSPLISKRNGSIESLPPVPPRLSSGGHRLKSTESLSPRPTSSGGSETELSESGDIDVFRAETPPPPIPPKSPAHARKWPQWMEDYKKQLEVEKEKTSEEGKENGVPGGQRDKEDGVVRPVPKVRSKLSKVPVLDFIGSPHSTRVMVQPPTPVSPDILIEPSLEVTTRMMLGQAESKEDKLSPCGICIGIDNILIVTDKTNGSVRMLKSTGRFLDSIGKDADIGQPVAVTTDGSGNIFVADTSPPRILKFTKTGNFLCKLVPKTLRTSILGDPRGLAITHDDHILVSDWEKSCVHIFDSTGKHLKDFSPQSEIFQPTGLSMDSRGRLLVADYSNHRIWIFTPDGDMLHQFGWEGQNPGDLYLPYGVTVDLKGHIIVTESGNHRISIFSNSGAFIKYFGEYGNELGQFQCPLNVCITSCGKLIVADEGNGRLQLFDKF